jgi:F0F1-type ATP synthase alpha subunit
LAFALREGLLDMVPIEAIALFWQALPRWLDENATEFVQTIEQTRSMDTVDRAELKRALSELATRHAGSVAV